MNHRPLGYEPKGSILSPVESIALPRFATRERRRKYFILHASCTSSDRLVRRCHKFSDRLVRRCHKFRRSCTWDTVHLFQHFGVRPGRIFFRGITNLVNAPFGIAFQRPKSSFRRKVLLIEENSPFRAWTTLKLLSLRCMGSTNSARTPVMLNINSRFLLSSLPRLHSWETLRS